MDSWYSGTLTEEECRQSKAYIRGFEDQLKGIVHTNPYHPSKNTNGKGGFWFDSDQCLYCYGVWACLNDPENTRHFGPPLYEYSNPVQLDLFSE